MVFKTESIKDCEIAEHPWITAVAMTTKLVITITYWPVPKTIRARLAPSRRIRLTPIWTTSMIEARDIPIHAVVG